MGSHISESVTFVPFFNKVVKKPRPVLHSLDEFIGANASL